MPPVVSASRNASPFVEQWKRLHGNNVRGNTDCQCSSRQPEARRPAPRLSYGHRHSSLLTHAESNRRVRPQRNTARSAIGRGGHRLAFARSCPTCRHRGIAASVTRLLQRGPRSPLLQRGRDDQRLLKSLRYGRLADDTLVLACLTLQTRVTLKYDLRTTALSVDSNQRS